MAPLVILHAAEDGPSEDTLPGGLTRDGSTIVARAPSTMGSTRLRRVWAYVDVDENVDLADIVLLEKSSGKLLPPTSSLSQHLGECEDAEVAILCATRTNDSNAGDEWAVRGSLFIQAVTPWDASVAGATRALAEDLERTVAKRKSFAPETRLRATAPLVAPRGERKIQDLVQVSRYVPSSVSSSTLPPGVQLREQSAQGSTDSARKLGMLSFAIIAAVIAVVLAYLKSSRQSV